MKTKLLLTPIAAFVLIVCSVNAVFSQSNTLREKISESSRDKTHGMPPRYFGLSQQKSAMQNRLTPERQSAAKPTYALSYKYSVDSLNENETRHDYTYFENTGFLSKEVVSKWEKENLKWWKDSLKYEYAYDIYNNMTNKKHSFADFEYGMWKPAVNEFIESFDSAGNKLSGNYNNYENKFNAKFDKLGNCIYFEYEAEDYHTKKETTYKNKNPLSTIEYIWHKNTSKWRNSSKTEYLYALSENTDLETGCDFSDWDTVQNKWVLTNRFRNEYGYYGNDGYRIVKYIYSKCDEQGVETYQSKRELQYSGKNVTSEIQYLWDTYNEKWKEYSKLEQTFNPNGLPTSYSIYYYQEPLGWIGAFKYTIDYGSNNKESAKIYFNWDSNTSQWTNDSKYEYTYDINDNLTSMVNSVWGTPVKGDWNPINKQEDIYDANNNLTSSTKYEWDNDVFSKTWKGSEKHSITYDYFKPLTELCSNKFFKTLYPEAQEYAGTDNTEPNEKGNAPTTYTYSVWSSVWKEWHTKKEIKYFYVPFNIKDGINAPATTELLVNVFPNPARDFITISGLEKQENMTIVDISGKTVMQKTVSPAEKISVSALPKGIYLVKVNDKTVKLAVK